MPVMTNTMTTPDGKLYEKLKNKPMTADNAPINDDITIIVDSRSANKYAVAAGVISRETTRITPTVCSDATVAKVSRTIIVLCMNYTGRPEAAAIVESKVDSRNSL